MNKPIWQIEGFSVDDQEMFNQLIERKEKIRKITGKKKFYGIISGLCAMATCLLIFYFLIWNTQSFPEFLDSKFSMSIFIAIGITICTNSIWSSYNKEEEKAKSKFNHLREEAIDRINTQLKSKYEKNVFNSLIEYLEDKQINVKYKS